MLSSAVYCNQCLFLNPEPSGYYKKFPTLLSSWGCSWEDVWNSLRLQRPWILTPTFHVDVSFRSFYYWGFFRMRPCLKSYTCRHKNTSSGSVLSGTLRCMGVQYSSEGGTIKAFLFGQPSFRRFTKAQNLQKVTTTVRYSSRRYIEHEKRKRFAQ